MSRRYRTKYGARKTVVNGIQFASQSEAERDAELCLLERAGEISNLVRQPKFILQPAFKHRGETIRAITYSPDWQYTENGQQILEDRKGVETDVFKLKWKWMKAKYPEFVYRITYK